VSKPSTQVSSFEPAPVALPAEAPTRIDKVPSLQWRVLLIHQAFASPAEGGGTRHYEFGQRAIVRGHNVTVVTSDLSYLTGNPVHQRRGLYAEQSVDGLRVLRSYAFPALHQSFLWRVFSFFTFTASSFLTALISGPVDLVMGTSPPIFQAFSAWAVAFLRRRPFLLEIRDLWPEFAIDMGVLKNPVLIWISRRLEDFLYARATHILINSPAYRDYLLRKGVAPLKVSLICNGVDPAMFDPAAGGEHAKEKWGLRGKFVVSYAGAIGMANDLGTLIRAAERSRDREETIFLIAGDGKERANIEADVRTRGLNNVIFTGTLSKNEVAELMAASNACVAMLKDIPMFRTTYPNKVFDYMAAGRPTVLAIDGVIRNVIEDSGAGICVPPGDDKALAEAVSRLVADPQQARILGLRGREYVIKHFNRSEQADEFVTLVEHLVGEWKSERHRWYRHFGKRAFDLLLAIPLTLVLMPFLGVVAFLVKVTSPGPAFFNQARLGKLGKIFVAYKFRTMLHRERTHHVEIREGNSEVTRIGKLLRRFKIDELPQVFNVLRGEMSLVGPRPPLPEQINDYDTETLQRLMATPGVTGLAQVNGGTQMSWPERWQYDLRYVHELSFGLDLAILLRTIMVVVLGEERFHNPLRTK
jgi:lipopolysaccharide/colanic/teichoic acid biosynthesis glycosyltransferase